MNTVGSICEKKKRKVADVYSAGPSNHNDADCRDTLLPIGYHFKPTDTELITHYLLPKIKNLVLPKSKIFDFNNVYESHPEEIADCYREAREGEWYFFTKRNEKYPNGKAGCGYWKVAGPDTVITSENGERIGLKLLLIYYEGKSPKGAKTEWKMHQYRVKGDTRKLITGLQEMKQIDDYLLCKISNKKYNKKKNNVVKLQPNVVVASNDTANGSINLQNDVAENDSANGSVNQPVNAASKHSENWLVNKNSSVGSNHPQNGSVNQRSCVAANYPGKSSVNHKSSVASNFFENGSVNQKPGAASKHSENWSVNKHSSVRLNPPKNGSVDHWSCVACNLPRNSLVNHKSSVASNHPENGSVNHKSSVASNHPENGSVNQNPNQQLKDLANGSTKVPPVQNVTDFQMESNPVVQLITDLLSNIGCVEYNLSFHCFHPNQQLNPRLQKNGNGIPVVVSNLDVNPATIHHQIKTNVINIQNPLHDEVKKYEAPNGEDRKTV